jgi:HlyD family secretion protein
VSFTVDAYPGEVFRGEVGKVRLNATMTQNVVTYTVEVITDNPGGKLFPYLTANVQFEVSRSSNVLLVPNSALRWSPKPQEVASEFRAASISDTAKNKSRESNQQPSPNHSAQAVVESIIWVQQGAYVRPIKVNIGLSDGTMTVVQGDELKEGLQIITGERQQQTGDTGTTNPFVPQIRRSRS